MIGLMIKAAIGSAHHQPKAAFRIKPVSRMAERYAQKSACLASATIAWLPSCLPICFLARESRGIATRAAQATTIPAMLCSGACFRSRSAMEPYAVYAASPRKQTPTILSVRRSVLSRFSALAMLDKHHSRATAEVTSIKLSTPNPTRETLPAMIPATTAASPSKMCHPMVRYSSRLPRRAIRANSMLLVDTRPSYSSNCSKLELTRVLLHLLKKARRRFSRSGHRSSP
jgi:hypothetical protein